MGLKILLLDDDEEFVPALVAFLRESGHHVFATCNWFEVFPALRSMEPDLALVDLKMPGIDGADVARTIKRFSNVRVYIHSSASDDEMAAAAVRAQADGFTRKGRPSALAVWLRTIEAKLAAAESAG